MLKQLWCSLFHREHWQEVEDEDGEPKMVTELKCSQCGLFHHES